MTPSKQMKVSQLNHASKGCIDHRVRTPTHCTFFRSSPSCSACLRCGGARGDSCTSCGRSSRRRRGHRHHNSSSEGEYRAIASAASLAPRRRRRRIGSRRSDSTCPQPPAPPPQQQQPRTAVAAARSPPASSLAPHRRPGMLWLRSCGRGWAGWGPDGRAAPTGRGDHRRRLSDPEAAASGGGRF